MTNLMGVWTGAAAWVRLGVMLVWSLAAATAGAQSLAVSGTVRDTTGVIPGATVVLVSPSGDRTVQTDGTGQYRFEGLAPGTFQVSVSMRGFQTAVRNVTVGSESAALDVVLEIGNVLPMAG